MKRIVKKGIKLFIIIVILLVLITVFCRGGWKLFGFALCNAPNGMYADNITVEDGRVDLRLNEAYSISSYAGYVYKIEDDNLFIGVNRNMLFAAFNGKVDYHISVLTNGTRIKNIYFKDNKNDWLIWNEEEGKIKASDIQPQNYRH